MGGAHKLLYKTIHEDHSCLSSYDENIDASHKLYNPNAILAESTINLIVPTEIHANFAIKFDHCADIIMNVVLNTQPIRSEKSNLNSDVRNKTYEFIAIRKHIIRNIL